MPKTPTVYWFETPAGGRLGTMGHPAGGAALAGSLAGLRDDGVDVLISLLGAPEQQELGLIDEPAEAASAGIAFRAMPIFDFATPPLSAETACFVAAIVADLEAGRSVVVHCWMGIGRSSTIAAGALCALGMAPAAALARISAARGRSVPDTAEQRAWVGRFAAAWPELRPRDME